MTTLWGRNVKHLLEITDHPAADLARAVGVSGATVSGWLTGGSKSIDGQNLLRVAEFFTIKPEALMYEDLSDLGIEDLRNPYQVTRAVSALRKVPVATKALLAEDGYWHGFEQPTAKGSAHVLYATNDPNAFALVVEGDALRPRYKPGETLVVEPSKQAEAGHEVAVKLRDGKIMVRVLDWRRNGMLQLSSVNEDQRPMTVREEAVDFLYRVSGAVQPDARSN